MEQVKGPYRQGLLARTNDESDQEEIVIELSDEESEYSSSSMSLASSGPYSSDEEDFQEIDQEDEFDGQSRQFDGQNQSRQNRNQPSNPDPSKKTLKKFSRHAPKLNWADEIDENQPESIGNHSNGSGNHGGSVSKRSSGGRGGSRSVGRSSFDQRPRYQDQFHRRSNDNSASLTGKWGHDLFEQHDNSDDESDRPRRVQKTPKKKSTPKKHVKELKLKKAIAPESTPIPVPKDTNTDEQPNWAETVAKESAAAIGNGSIKEEISKEPSETVNDLAPAAVQVTLAELSIQSTEPEKSMEHSNVEAVDASVSPAPPMASTESQQSSTQGAARPRRVISQASKNQLMASFNRAGGILLRNALEKPPPSTTSLSPIPPRSLSPVSNTSATVPSTSEIPPANTTAHSTPSQAPPLPAPVAAAAHTKEKVKQTPQVNTKDRDLRSTLSNRPKESVQSSQSITRENPSRDRDGNHRDRDSRQRNDYRDSSSRGNHRDDRQKGGDRSERDRRPPRDRESPSGSLNTRDYNNRDIRRNSTQDSRDSTNSRVSLTTHPLDTNKPAEKERFVIEKRPKQKKPESKQRNPDSAISDHVPSPQALKDMAPKVIPTSTGWALVNPTPGGNQIENDQPRSSKSRNNDYNQSSARSGGSNQSKYENHQSSSSSLQQRSYKSKRQPNGGGSHPNSANSVSSDPQALPYTPPVQPMINVQPMMTQSGHMVLLTESGLCVPATPGMFQYQQWYDTTAAAGAPSVNSPGSSASQGGAAAPISSNSTANYPNYYTTNYYASSSNTKEK